MTSVGFTRKIIADNRVTIPPEIMILLELKQGDLIHVDIQKAVAEVKE